MSSSEKKDIIARSLGLYGSSDSSTDVSEYSPHGNHGKARSSRRKRLKRRLNLKALRDQQPSDSSDDSAGDGEETHQVESTIEMAIEMDQDIEGVHTQVKHFKLPVTQKQQKAKGIGDDRDPNDYGEFVTARSPLPMKRGKPTRKAMEMKKKEQHKPKKKLKDESRPVASPKGRPNSTASPLPCHFNQFDVCDEFFSTQADLDAHHRYHLCIRPYKCTWPRCSFRSETRAPILVHLKVHIKKGDGHNSEDYVDVDEEQLVSPI